jgi:hypothetical protein
MNELCVIFLKNMRFLSRHASFLVSLLAIHNLTFTFDPTRNLAALI